VDQNLRGLFERALETEPAPPGDFAHEVMIRGTRLRRRRSLLAGGGAAGVVAVLAIVAALNMTAPTSETTPPVARAAMRMQVSAACTLGADRRATDALVFLRADITDQQRLDLDRALQSDPLLRSVRFQSQEQAYARFLEVYKDAPELMGGVKAEMLPESFIIKIAEPSKYPTFLAKFKDSRGVEEIDAWACPQGSGEGE
jgi:cell division transport system permease protein